jgi:ubiquinone/menaquinone biosynthesis C-methylase UbiE
LAQKVLEVKQEMMGMEADVRKFMRFCDSEFGKKVMKKEAQYVYNELRNCRTILDVGCGIGSFEHNLPNLNIIGIDHAKEMLHEAKRRSDKDLVLGDTRYLGFKNSAFDAVFTVTTLEFLDSYKETVTEIARVNPVY